MKFIPVDPTKMEDLRNPRRGRVSYPLLKSFLETGMFMAQLDRTGMQQSTQALSTSLNSYIRSHNLPIKLLMRGGQLYLMRLDIDANGNEIKDWGGRVEEDYSVGPATPITPDEVAARFIREKNKVTK